MGRPDHRTNLTSTAIILFRAQGFAATGLNQIVADGLLMARVQRSTAVLLGLQSVLRRSILDSDFQTNEEQP